MSNVFFTSDSHFGHQNVIKYSSRPWTNIEDMNKGLIENWNDVVKKGDSVYHLGDFALTTQAELIDSWLGKLNGMVYLVKGNHDAGWVRRYDKLKHKNKIRWIKDYAEKTFKVDEVKYKFILCHFPLLFWHGSHWGAIHLHGHSHGSAQHLNEGLRRMDVGVDVNDHRPIQLETIIERMKDLGANPHHERYNKD